MIYLDNAATTQIDDRVLNAMFPYLTGKYGNPGTIYAAGRMARDAVENARFNVAKVFNCEPEEVVFTSGGSEGNNLVISGLRPFMNMLNRRHIISSNIEHDSVLGACQNMAYFDGFVYETVKARKDGTVSCEDVDEKLYKDVGLVSVMFTNNETGVSNDVEAISKVVHENSAAVFHTDCVQALGSEVIDVERIGCDFATISSHKIHGPKGIGAIYARKRSLLVPIIKGGITQEFGVRGGTENVAGIVGFGEACKILVDDFESNREKVRYLREVFKNAMQKEIPEARFNCYENGSKVLSITLPGIDSQSFILLVGDRLCVSAGSACNAHNNDASHVMMAIGLSEEDARSTIRVSFSRMNTEQECLDAVDIISKAAKTIRNII